MKSEKTLYALLYIKDLQSLLTGFLSVDPSHIIILYHLFGLVVKTYIPIDM